MLIKYISKKSRKILNVLTYGPYEKNYFIKRNGAQSFGSERTFKSIVYTLVPVKKCNLASLTLGNVMTTYLKHMKCMKTEVILFMSHRQEHNSFSI